MSNLFSEFQSEPRLLIGTPRFSLLRNFQQTNNPDRSPKHKLRKSMKRKVDFDSQVKKINNGDLTIRHSSPHIKADKTKGSRKYFKNRSCIDQFSNLDLDECMAPLIVIDDPVVINNGTFGILLRFNTTDGYVAVKFIFNISKDSSKTKFIEMEKELAFTYFMSETGIGPKVLDAFFYNIDFDHLKFYPNLERIFEIIENHFKNKGKTYKQFIPIEKRNETIYDLPIEIQCVVMKSYDDDCQSILSNENIGADIKTEIIKSMVFLVSEQMRLSLYCYDIKPGNFVVNFESDGSVDVKMIDFGADYCTENNIYANYKNEDIVPYIKITFMELLYISNVIQLYMIFSFHGFNGLDKHNNRQEINNIMHAFFSHDLFKHFFESEWKKFITWYIALARKNNIKSLSDPSNILVWYVNKESDRKKIYSFDNLINITDSIVRNLSEVLNYVNFAQF